jgi:hypothetical protein
VPRRASLGGPALLNVRRDFSATLSDLSDSRVDTIRVSPTGETLPAAQAADAGTPWTEADMVLSDHGLHEQGQGVVADVNRAAAGSWSGDENKEQPRSAGASADWQRAPLQALSAPALASGPFPQHRASDCQNVGSARQPPAISRAPANGARSSRSKRPQKLNLAYVADGAGAARAKAAQPPASDQPLRGQGFMSRPVQPVRLAGHLTPL